MCTDIYVVQTHMYTSSAGELSPSMHEVLSVAPRTTGIGSVGVSL